MEEVVKPILFLECSKCKLNKEIHPQYYKDADKIMKCHSENCESCEDKCIKECIQCQENKEPDRNKDFAVSKETRRKHNKE